MTALVFRKLLNNRWMFACLLIGFIIIAAVVACIPIYSTAILQRMLKVDLQQYQSDNNVYPGNYTVDVSYMTTSYGNDFTVSAMDEYIDYSVSQIGVPTIAQVNRLNLTALGMWRPDMLDAGPIYMNTTALSDMEGKVRMIHGHFPSAEMVEYDGEMFYEVIINASTMKEMSLSMDQKWYLALTGTTLVKNPETRIPVKVVGVFEPVDASDPYWYMDESTYINNFFMNYDALKTNFSENFDYIGGSVWYYAFDYTQIDIKDIHQLIDSINTQKEQYAALGANVSFTMPALKTMEGYLAREKTLNILLWILIVPVLVMLSFYIFMVSRLKLENEANEIAVLKSRGASTGQIFRGYIMEWGLLSGVALLAGPPLGYLLCRILGSSNGFMEFVNRTALKLTLSPVSYLYVLLAMLLFAVSMLAPAYKASKITIVEYKQRTSTRKKKAPLWQLLGVDVILIGIALYGFWKFTDLQSTLTTGDASVSDMGTDPLTFALSSLFLLGAGLLFLRFYPYIVRFIFFLGRKFWSPVLYSSFIRVSRSRGKEIFVMLFIIYSISTGLFSANAARTLNTNGEDRVRYAAAVDGKVLINWSGADLSEGSTTDSTQVTGSYNIPNMNKFREISGIEAATTVSLPKANSYTLSGSSAAKLTVMGIEPSSFGETVWMRDDLLDYHINEYLNLINGAPNAVILSSDLKEKYAVGDTVTIRCSEQGNLSCVVYAFVDYWPGFEKTTYDANGAPVQNTLAVINLDTLQKVFPFDGYQIWFKRAENSTIANLDYGIKQVVNVTNILWTSQDLVKLKNDPMLQGINGMLTLVFIITMVITTIGFLIYWILSIYSRTLQFGIFRAMGIRLRSIIAMIISEQVLISVCAIFVGILLGALTSYLFVPLFQTVTAVSEQTLPFVVVYQRGDYLKIYAVIGVMLVGATLVLSRIIASMKMDQALKLGED